MYKEEKFRRLVYEYADKNNLEIDDLTANDFEKVLREITDEIGSDFLEECLSTERKELINPMLKMANEILDKAFLTDEKDAKLIAMEAYQTSHECFEALMLWVNLEDNFNEKLKIIDIGIKYEEDKLKRLGFFNKEYFGKFYDTLETRNYLRLLRSKVDLFTFVGRIGMAKDLCLYILRLDKSDHLNATYVLLNIYAYQEDKDNLLELKKMCNEESLETVFPLLVLYYKLNEMDKVQEYFDKIKNMSIDFVNAFKKCLENVENKNEIKKSVSSNMLMFFASTDFLISSVPGLVFYIVGS